MDFSLTEEQKMLRAMVQDFATKELEPIAAQIDEEAKFPAENVKKMAELGLMGLGFPEEYGGSGNGTTELCIVTEEISRVCASTSTIYFVTAGLAGHPLYEFVCTTVALRLRSRQHTRCTWRSSSSSPEI